MIEGRGGATGPGNGGTLTAQGPYGVGPYNVQGWGVK